MSVTAAGLGVSYVLSELGLGKTVAPALPAFVWAGLFGGLVPAGLSIVMVAVYSHIFLVTEFGRAAVVNTSYLATAAVIGWFFVKIHRYDSLNGNLARLQTAMEAEDQNIEMARFLNDRWDDLTDEQRRNQLRRLTLSMFDNRHHIAHLSTLVFGWMAIRREMTEAERQARWQLLWARWTRRDS